MDNPNKPAAKKPAVKKPILLYKNLVPADWRDKPTQNCHYVFYDGAGAKHQWISDVCFARFSSVQGIVKGKFLINQHNKVSTYANNAAYITKVSFQAQLLVWINWIVKQSPFRWAFTNGKTNFLEHGLNFNCKMPHKYVFGACNAIREGWEFPWRVEYWHRLVDAGVSKELSYYVVSMMGRSEKSIYGGQGHAVMQRNPSGQAYNWFRSLTKEKVLAIGSPMSKTAPSTIGVSSLFCEGMKPEQYKDLFGKGVDLKQLLINHSVHTKSLWGDAQIKDFSLTSPALLTTLKGIDNA